MPTLSLAAPRRPLVASAVPPLLAGLLLGAAIGALTSLGQSLGVLNGTLNPLVNSVSAWVVAPFLLPLALRVPPARGALVGAAVCVAEVAGYYATAHLRGFAAGTDAYVWAACALGAGPVFGWLGAVRRRPGHIARPAASAALPAVLLAEAVVSLALRNGYYDEAALLAALALALALRLVRGRAALGWLLALSVGMVAVLELAARAVTLAGVR